MMRKGEIGQALILVLILLAIGSLLVVPQLGLVSTSIKNTDIIDQRTRALYVVDAAQEYTLWKLQYDGLAAGLENNGDNVSISGDICGISFNATVILRSVASEGPVVFATQHVIRPIVKISPDTVLNNTTNDHTYTIDLEQLSDNTSQGLDAIYLALPKGFGVADYSSNSSEIRTDGGLWESIDDPLIETEAGQVRLLWPATYDYDTGTGGFTSPFRDFNIRQEKDLRFQISGKLGKNENHPSWVVLKPWDTLSGASGILKVGDPSPPNTMEGGMVQAYATTDPEVIYPGEVEDIEYSYLLTNLDKETLILEEIKCWLPAGFTYTDNSTTGLTESNPTTLSLENINGQDRWYMEWIMDDLPGGSISMASADTVPLFFWAQTSLEVSGTYYTELMAIPSKSSPGILRKIGVDDEEYVTNYSWNTGPVVVPHYDCETTTDGVVIDTNLGIVPGGFAFLSWNIR